MTAKVQTRDGVSRSLLIAPAVYAADQASSAVDLRDHSNVELMIAIGVGGITFDATNKVEFKLTHSDVVGSGYTAVAAKDVILPAGFTLAAGGIVRSLVAAHAAATVFGFDYVGDKRFVILTADFSGTHATGTALSAHARLSRGRIVP